MFRLWGKIWTDNHLIKDTVICDETDDTRTHKIFNSLEEICYLWDLSKPIWLEHNIKDFKKHNQTRFYPDNFIDSVNFDYLEIIIIEE
ncbi:MAG: hypothetical protein EOM40_11745 [Clostridia bacterium]|nr:hypothetical protein [Clostridia bacterium]NCC43698.1 hypothetical protein [Clostridia bacterium]